VALAATVRLDIDIKHGRSAVVPLPIERDPFGAAFRILVLIIFNDMFAVAPARYHPAASWRARTRLGAWWAACAKLGPPPPSNGRCRYLNNTNGGRKQNFARLLLCSFWRKCIAYFAVAFAPGSWNYSITSSAVASNIGGTLRPKVLAVLRLIAKSNFAGCMTGRLAGFSPFKIRATYTPPCR
jgi:hypothetical protein